MWILGIGAILGNVGAICLRVKQMTRRLTVQLLLIVNLSISDLLMGIYLLILKFVDTYYTDYFPSHSDTWRNSILCQVAGTFSVLSSQASVFFITLISIDRYLGIKFPFSGKHLSSKSTKFVIVMLWTLAFVISISLFAFTADIPEVCISLPISRNLVYEIKTLNHTFSKVYEYSNHPPISDYEIMYNTDIQQIGSEPSMFFSIAIFIGLNLICFLIVMFCYLSIFIEAQRSPSQTGRSRSAEEEMRMAKKMSAIVLTDFCCWMPIIILSILVPSNVVTIPPVAFVWIVTFVLPINSTINPFLYTLATFITDWLDKRKRSRDEAIELHQLDDRPKKV